MNISKRIFRFSTVLVLAVIFRCSEAEDWTQFRGPTGQGTSTATKMPVRWSQIQNVVWNQEEAKFHTPADVFGITHGMCGPTVMTHGTDEQKEKWLIHNYGLPLRR